MAYYDALVAKWSTLTGTTDQKLAAINALTVSGPAVSTLVPGWRIYSCLAPSEFQALTAPQQQFVRDIFMQVIVDVSPGTTARAVLQQLFGAGTTTRTNLANLVAHYDTPNIPWWQATVAQGGGGLASPVTNNDLAAAGLS